MKYKTSVPSIRMTCLGKMSHGLYTPCMSSKINHTVEKFTLRIWYCKVHQLCNAHFPVHRIKPSHLNPVMVMLRVEALKFQQHTWMLLKVISNSKMFHLPLYHSNFLSAFIISVVGCFIHGCSRFEQRASQKVGSGWLKMCFLFCIFHTHFFLWDRKYSKCEQVKSIFRVLILTKGGISKKYLINTDSCSDLIVSTKLD